MPRPEQDGTWITDELERGYCELNRRGFARRMFDNGVPWIDCQVYTEHLARFGAKEIPRAEYLEMLNSAVVSIANHKRKRTESTLGAKDD